MPKTDDNQQRYYTNRKVVTKVMAEMLKLAEAEMDAIKATINLPALQDKTGTGHHAMVLPAEFLYYASVNKLLPTTVVKFTEIDETALTQCRSRLNAAKVDEYAAYLNDGFVLPPPFLVQTTEGVYLVADGWHRFSALQKNGATEFVAHVAPGGAVLAYAIGVAFNSRHGLALTQVDRAGISKVAFEKHAIEIEQEILSRREVGRMYSISHTAVNKRVKKAEPSPTEASAVHEKLRTKKRDKLLKNLLSCANLVLGSNVALGGSLRLKLRRCLKAGETL